MSSIVQFVGLEIRLSPFRPIIYHFLAFKNLEMESDAFIHAEYSINNK